MIETRANIPSVVSNAHLLPRVLNEPTESARSISGTELAVQGPHFAQETFRERQCAVLAGPSPPGAVNNALGVMGNYIGGRDPMAGFFHCASFTNCTFNFGNNPMMPQAKSPPPAKRRRLRVIDSSDEVDEEWWKAVIDAGL